MGSSPRSCPWGKTVTKFRRWEPVSLPRRSRSRGTTASPVRPWQTLSFKTPTTNGSQGGWRGPKSLTASHIPLDGRVGRGTLRAQHALRAPGASERSLGLSAQPAAILLAQARSSCLLFVPPVGMGAARQRRTRALASPPAHQLCDLGPILALSTPASFGSPHPGVLADCNSGKSSAPGCQPSMCPQFPE